MKVSLSPLFFAASFSCIGHLTSAKEGAIRGSAQDESLVGSPDETQSLNSRHLVDTSPNRSTYNSVALRTAHNGSSNKYVRGIFYGGQVDLVGAVGDWEIWEIASEGTVSTSGGSKEIFSIKNLAFGRYLRAIDNGDVDLVSHVQDWEKWYKEDQGDGTFCFHTYYNHISGGQYLRAKSDGSVDLAPSCGSWEKFKLESQPSQHYRLVVENHTGRKIRITSNCNGKQYTQVEYPSYSKKTKDFYLLGCEDDGDNSPATIVAEKSKGCILDIGECWEDLPICPDSGCTSDAVHFMDVHREMEVKWNLLGDNKLTKQDD